MVRFGKETLIPTQNEWFELLVKTDRNLTIFLLNTVSNMRHLRKTPPHLEKAPFFERQPPRFSFFFSPSLKAKKTKKNPALRVVHVVARRSDLPRNYTVHVYCPMCRDIYTPRSSRSASIDGAYFGTTRASPRSCEILFFV